MPPANISTKRPRSAEEVREQVALDLYSLSTRVGAGVVEEKLGATDPGTLGNAVLGKHTPRLHTVLNALLVDPSALTNTLLLYGVVAVPAETGEVDDNAVIAALLRSASDYFDRMKDHRRCHQDTLALAEIFKPLVPALLAIVREAGAIRGAA